MSTNTSKKSRIYIYITFIILGTILACSSIIPNDYLKLTIVMISLAVGLYGIMKCLSTPNPTEDISTKE